MVRKGYRVPRLKGKVFYGRIREGYIYRGSHHLWDIMDWGDRGWTAMIWSERLDSLHEKGMDVEPVIESKHGFDSKKEAVDWAMAFKFDKGMVNYIHNQVKHAGPPWIIGG